LAVVLKDDSAVEETLKKTRKKKPRNFWGQRSAGGPIKKLIGSAKSDEGGIRKKPLEGTQEYTRKDIFGGL